MSAVVMLGIGTGAIASGGLAYVGLITLVVAGMNWELSRMMVPDKPWLGWGMGLASAGVLLASVFVSPRPLIEAALVPGLIGVLFAQKDRLIFGVYATLIVVSGLGLLMLYDAQGVFLVIWLICVVVATDVAGYFAGKAIGGKKFWPSISPKKTWAGILAGWVAAACVGWLMGGDELAVVSAFMSFASQLGDIAESAIKRRCGVKDSSNLIPGHGGLLDRFDGLIAANLVVVIALLTLGLQVHPG
jgi:phosphatidate cytidylyltransferase